MALNGLRVIEMAGLGPSSFCGMILADFGASVIRVDKKPKDGPVETGPRFPIPETLGRGKKSIALDVKSPQGVSIFKNLISSSDVLIEPFRPGVMEKLKLGPNELNVVNPKLIYARLSGFGQTGPFAMTAGHDINFLAASGVLSFLGRSGQKPTPPINILGSFCGGGLLCAYAILAAHAERGRSEKGQVIDMSVTEGAAYVSSYLFTTQRHPIWGKPRGHNLYDSGAHFYDTFVTKDGCWLAIGPLEKQFYFRLLEGLGLSSDPELQTQFGDFESKKIKINARFKEKTQAEWMEIFEKLDACVSPMEDWSTVHQTPLSKFRKSFLIDKDGHVEPAPAPKLSRTPANPPIGPGPNAGENSLEILEELGYSNKEIEHFKETGIIK